MNVTKRIRIIPKLEIKGSTLIKGVEFEGLRSLGNPSIYAKFYDGYADEILVYDVYASLLNREPSFATLRAVAEQTSIPVIYAGGITSPDLALKALDNGADKIGVNTSNFEKPHLISQLASMMGSQSVVGIVEYNYNLMEQSHCYTVFGRQKTSIAPEEMTKRLLNSGAGEILFTCIGRDGRFSGLDLDFLAKIRPHVNSPLIISGGFKSEGDVFEASQLGVDAICISSSIHYDFVKCLLDKGSIEMLKLSEANEPIELANFEWLDNGYGFDHFESMLTVSIEKVKQCAVNLAGKNNNS
ncbi:HisA/HisF-related TIM barrel protein [Alphaproteobacteria bacterium]|nr:HisA/HisF-related TIM barrel protein [Alphaproteobacteria bacterium]